MRDHHAGGGQVAAACHGVPVEPGTVPGHARRLPAPRSPTPARCPAGCSARAANDGWLAAGRCLRIGGFDAGRRSQLVGSGLFHRRGQTRRRGTRRLRDFGHLSLCCPGWKHCCAGQDPHDRGGHEQSGDSRSDAGCTLTRYLHTVLRGRVQDRRQPRAKDDTESYGEGARIACRRAPGRADLTHLPPWPRKHALCSCGGGPLSSGPAHQPRDQLARKPGDFQAPVRRRGPSARSHTSDKSHLAVNGRLR